LTCDSRRSRRSASAVVMANMDLRKSWVTEFCMRLVNGTVPEHEWWCSLSRKQSKSGWSMSHAS